MSDEVVSVEVVRHFCHIAARRLGVGIDPKVAALVAGRVAKRLKVLQLPLDDYLSRLDEDEHCDEVVGFLDVMRPRPLPFFARAADHAQLYARLGRWLDQGRRRFRLWSAGCGSGEEPYAMALTVLKALVAARIPPENIDLKILATDLSPRVLARGRHGVFDEEQFRCMRSSLREHYFFEVTDGLAIDPEVKAHVVFRRLNLAHPPFPMTGPMDAIFFSEGLVPLLPRARRCATEAARGILAADGVFCTGLDEEDDCVDACLDDRQGGEEEGAGELLWADGLRGSRRSPGNC
jgi:chemotaxis protein methyltransferase CheR